MLTKFISYIDGLNMDNRHAENAKGMKCNPEFTGINASRTIASSDNWFGCGYLDKSNAQTNQEVVRFPFYSMVLIVEGEGEYIDCKGNRTSLLQGMVFQRVPDVPHAISINHKKAWREYYLDCNVELFTRLRPMLNINAEEPIVGKLEPAYYEYVFENLINATDSSTCVDVFNVYLQFLALLNDVIMDTRSSRQHKKGGEFSMGIIVKDFENLYKARFELKGYCSKKGIQYEAFRKLFKMDFGVSPQQYLIKRRMDEACKLLLMNKLTIQEISFELGYISPYEFSNQFKRHYQISPRKYKLQKLGMNT